ncbi:MAG: cupredoxin domain-containing protein, partial [Chloroflexota bacterium]|nr:cupredoxin domain-containing protein [Chloroflexota bacterium]
MTRLAGPHTHATFDTEGVLTMSAGTLQRLPTAVLGALAGLGFTVLTHAAHVHAADTSVTIVDDAFQPASVTISVGDTVTWVNTGDHPHTVTADDGSFDSGELDTGGTFSHTFTSAGTFGYH